MSAAQTNVMLVDDHSVVRMGFRLLLEGSSDIRVVAEGESGEDAVRRFDESRPDGVVMDISMPGIGGLEAIRRILAREPAARILVLSAHEDAMHARRVLKAGAVGYLTKRSAAEALIQRSEEHTSELQSLTNLVCRLLLEKKKKESRPRTPHDSHTHRT